MIHYPNDEPFGLTRYKNFDDQGTINFSPLMSIQRYVTVRQVLQKYSDELQLSTIAEFGSGTFTFFLNHLLECDFIDTVHEVDVNEDRIYSALHTISTERERRFRVKKGRKPLTVNVFQGNIAEKDDRLLNSDAVVAIEVIEHLVTADLERFPETIFGFMKPKLAVFTTPNYDFNVLFENDGAFRDDDHKFEFTRQQFRDWADNIINEYPDYYFELYGIGEPPEDCSLDVGFCSQMAVFRRSLKYQELDSSTSTLRNYTLLGSYSYFVFEELRTVMSDVMDTMRSIRNEYEDDERYAVKFPCENCDYHFKITLPLDFVLKHCEICKDIKTLETTLQEYSFNFPILYDDNVPHVVIRDECDCNS